MPTPGGERRQSLVVVGTLIQTPAPDRLEILPDVTVEVDATGTVVAVHPAGSTSGVDAERRAGT